MATSQRCTTGSFPDNRIVGGDALTEFIGHHVLKDHIRRQIRRHRGKS